MRPAAKILCLCLSALLLCFSLAACRNKDFTPATPPTVENEKGEASLPADLQCWVRTADGIEYPLMGEKAAAIYEVVQKAYKSSDTVDAFPDGGTSLRLIFCLGGTAPESSIPAYQLPNATLYEVYTVFPDDKGWYGDNLITAHVHAFRLKEGAYASLLDIAGRES